MATNNYSIESVTIQGNGSFKIEYTNKKERKVRTIVGSEHDDKLTLRLLSSGRFPLADYELKVDEEGEIGNMATLRIVKRT